MSSVTPQTVIRLWAIATSLVLFAGVSLGEESSAELARKIHAVDGLFSIISDGSLPGAAVAVLQGDTVVLSKGYGMADIAGGVAVTPRTRFRIGSVTKTLTAIAVLQLAEQGKLSLHDSLDKFFPDLPFARAVKIRHLLSHTAGVPDFIPESAVKNSTLEFEPGSRINYSNTGYHMLGRIIESVAGRSWDECISEQILEPLEMKDTGFDLSRELAGRAAGYQARADGSYAALDLGDAKGAYAAGGLYSSAEDMLLLVRGLRTGKILGKEMFLRATTPQVLSDGRSVAYGLGWMTRDYRGLREAGHGGDIGGFNAYLAHYPDEDLAVVVLSNVEMRPPGKLPEAAALTHQIVDIWFGSKLKTAAVAEPVSVPVELLDRYVGRYRIEAPETIRRNMGDEIAIEREGDRLRAEANGRDVGLVALSPSRFQGPNSPVELEFVCDGTGPCPKVVISLMGLREFHATRIVELAP